MFVERLATAPWNRPWLRSPGEYVGVGRGLLRLAILHSYQFGLGGRVELTVRPGSREENWYDRQGFALAVGPEDGMNEYELRAVGALPHLTEMGVVT